MDRHLSICPYCVAEGLEEAESWQDLAEGIRRLLVPDTRFDRVRHDSVGPEVGDIRPIRADLSRWKDDFFYNPPVVVVIEAHSSISGAALVVQTYHDLTLAGPGDLILDEDRSPVGEIFLEPWNTYTLRAEDLGPAAGNVGAEVVEAVKALEADPDVYPKWAMHPRPMAPEDVRLYFREMEVEVGYVFSSQAAEAVLEELENQGPRLVYPSFRELRTAMEARAPGLRWSSETASIEETLVLARFSDDYLQMAAQEKGAESIAGNLVIFEAGVLKELRPIRIEIIGRTGALVVSGRLMEPVKPPRGGTFICRFVLPSGRAIAPKRVRWDEDEGHFAAEFETHGETAGRLSAALVFEDPPL